MIQVVATQTPATWGLDRIDQRDLPLSSSYTYNQTGQGVHRLRDRHRHPLLASGVRRPEGRGFHRRRAGHERLQRPRHPRRRHDRRHDLRRRQAGDAPPRPRAQLLGSGSNSGVIAGVGLGDGNHVEPPAVANMSLGGARRPRSTSRQSRLDRRRRLAIAANSNATRATARPHDGRLGDQHMVPTHARRSPTTARASTSSRRARASPPPGRRRTPRRTRSAGRRWRRRTWAGGSRPLPAGEPDRVARDGDAGAAREHDREQGDEPGHGLAEPAALLGVRVRRRATRRRRRRRSPRRRTAPRSAARRPSRRTRATTSASPASSSSSTGRSSAPTRPRPTRSRGTRPRCRTAATRCRRGLRRGRERRLERRVGVTVSNATGGGELIANGGFEGLRLPVDALGERVLVDGRLSAFRHRLHRARRLQQRERLGVPDREHPGRPSGEPHLLAQHHDERVAD